LRGVPLALSFFFACDSNSPTPLGDVPSPIDATAAVLDGPETFAVDTFFLGEADQFGDPPSATAWESFGYDLDGRVTTAISKDVCTLAAGAPAGNQIDGTGGVDNSFGSLFVPFLFGTLFGPPAFPSQAATAALRDGDFTVQLQLNGLPADGHDTTGISLAVFTGGYLAGGAPAFDMTTSWPVVASSVSDGMTVASGAVVQFHQGYMTRGVFVSGDGPDQTLRVPMSFLGVPVILPVHHPVITFTVSLANPSVLLNGIIAGVVDIGDALASTNQFVKGISCGVPLAGFDQQVGQMADILHDGTNMAGVPCDAMSIGIGFSARQIANPTAVVPDAPVSDRCADAGSDAGADE
jgi:hypothetical protein